VSHLVRVAWIESQGCLAAMRFVPLAGAHDTPARGARDGRDLLQVALSRSALSRQRRVRDGVGVQAPLRTPR
jgi:hypothetical protein